MNRFIHLFVLTGLMMFFLPSVAQLDFSSTSNGRVMGVADQNGVSLLKSKYSPDIEGSPFVHPDWAIAELLLSSGKQYKNIKAKFNLESNEIYFLDTMNNVLVPRPGLVKKISFSLLFSQEGFAYIFKSGYPAIEKQGENYYYEVLAEGKIDFIRRYYKDIKTIKYDMSGEIKKEFVEGSNYYLFTGGIIKELKREKMLVAELMNDKKTEIDGFILANKLNLKKTTEVQKLVRYYNSISK